MKDIERAMEPRNFYGLLLPPGFHFLPTNEEVITCYLLEKVLQKPSPFPFPYVDGRQLYEKPPYRVGQVNIFEKHNAWYFFAPLSKEHHDGQTTVRLVKDKGYWEPDFVDEPILDQHKNVIGFKNSLVYVVGDVKTGGRRTSWVMDEFKLNEEHYGEQIAAKNLWIAGRIRWVVEDDDESDSDLD